MNEPVDPTAPNSPAPNSPTPNSPTLSTAPTSASEGRQGSVREVFQAFLFLGLTSFGGPIAHLGYLREAFVVRRRWLSERAYADLVALCQFLPGPASSQVGMALGLRRAGPLGLLAAWTAFTLPSAALLTAFAVAVGAAGVDPNAGWLRGLTAAAVAVVAHAVVGMARTLAPDRPRATIAVVALAIAVLIPTAGGQVTAICCGILIALIWLRQHRPEDDEAQDAFAVPLRRRTGVVLLVLFAVLLALLPVLAATTSTTAAGPAVGVADGFYRAGSLVFGGGHVVLPLLDAETVQHGLVTQDDFLAGYGAAQAVPGPLFTFAAYLGAVRTAAPSGVAGAGLALIFIFLPSALLVAGTLPFWEQLRRSPRARRVLAGAGAAVVGLLGAALYNPVFTHGITSAPTLVLAVAAFVALSVWKAPAWSVVAAGSVTGLLVL